MAKKNKSEGSPYKSRGIESKMETYQRPMGIAGIALIVIALGYVGFNRFYVEPQQAKALSAMYKAEEAFGNDSFKLALNGTPAFEGFIDISSGYGLTKAGNLANYYAGICCLKIANSETDSTKRVTWYEDAIYYLKKFDTDSEVLGPMGLGARADAHAELGAYDKAASYYVKAADASENNYTSPIYLKKAGLTNEKLGNYAEAAKLYQQIKDDYPSSQTAQGIDKYIARSKAMQ